MGGDAAATAAASDVAPAAPPLAMEVGPARSAGGRPARLSLLQGSEGDVAAVPYLAVEVDAGRRCHDQVGRLDRTLRQGGRRGRLHGDARPQRLLRRQIDDAGLATPEGDRALRVLSQAGSRGQDGARLESAAAHGVGDVPHRPYQVGRRAGFPLLSGAAYSLERACVTPRAIAIRRPLFLALCPDRPFPATGDR